MSCVCRYSFLKILNLYFCIFYLAFLLILANFYAFKYISVLLFFTCYFSLNFLSFLPFGHKSSYHFSETITGSINNSYFYVKSNSQYLHLFNFLIAYNILCMPTFLRHFLCLVSSILLSPNCIPTPEFFIWVFLYGSSSFAVPSYWNMSNCFP